MGLSLSCGLEAGTQLGKRLSFSTWKCEAGSPEPSGCGSRTWRKLVCEVKGSFRGLSTTGKEERISTLFDTLSFLISYSHPYYTSHLVFYLSVDRFLPTWIFFTLRGDGQNQREISWCHERELGAYLSELFRRSVSAGEDERMVTVWCDVHSSWHKPVAVSRQAQTYHAQPSPLCLTSRR